MRKPVNRFLPIMLSAMIAASGIAQESKIQTQGSLENPYLVPHFSGKIEIDGDLAESIWLNALTIDLPYETDPGENIEAPVKTSALLLYNNSHLFVAFRAYDPDPKSIRARYSDRDQLWYDDYVLIFLDTFNDERRAFALRSNPLGVQADDIRLANSQEVSWDAIFESKGQITDWGYCVEMAIPFNQLRFQRKESEQVWGMNLMRSYPREVLHRIDAIPLDRNNDSVIAQFIKMKGFDSVEPGKNVSVLPSTIAAQTDSKPDFPDGKMKNESRDLSLGASARWGLTPNLTFSGTANPDFSQVEADAYQLDINEPFALQYPEKRPFFQEGSDYFSTLKPVVYTRVLRDPVWGAKLTGKENGNTIGAYVVQDEITNLIIPGSQGSSSESLNQKNISAVLRYKRDIGNNVTFGLMATDREADDYFNRFVGVDGDIRLSNSDRVRFQFMGSSTQYPDAVADEYGQGKRKLNDSFIAFEYDHNSRNWGWWLDYDNAGKKFRADLGFIPMVGFQNIEGGLNYILYNKPNKWWSYFYMSGDLHYYEDQDGNPLQKSATVQISYSGTMQSHAHISANVAEELYNGQTFDLTYWTSCFGFWINRNLNYHHHILYGDRIDYDNTQLGTRFRIDPECTINFSRHMQVGFSHIYEKMTVDAGDLYTANIDQLMAVYHFNVRTFFRAILQYVNYNYNVENYLEDIDSEYKYLFTQLLFSYKINPFTVFFLGYSDNHTGNQSFRLTQQNRTVFAKVSYAWTL